MKIIICIVLLHVAFLPDFVESSLLGCIFNCIRPNSKPVVAHPYIPHVQFYENSSNEKKTIQSIIKEGTVYVVGVVDEVIVGIIIYPAEWLYPLLDADHKRVKVSIKNMKKLLPNPVWMFGEPSRNYVFFTPFKTSNRNKIHSAQLYQPVAQV